MAVAEPAGSSAPPQPDSDGRGLGRVQEEGGADAHRQERLDRPRRPEEAGQHLAHPRARLLGQQRVRHMSFLPRHPFSKA